MEVRAELFEEVREPVPPVARLEDDLWVLTGFRELSRERFPVVVEMDRLEDGARRVLVDDYRTAPVEVDADVTLLHGCSPSSWGCAFRSTECANTRFPTTRRTLVL